ncbi:MAG TPA: D-glycero-beta-D-manno-heptose-7-phosphate kinase [Gemmatimonadales bacterium]|nr:D-glycero-beta-D-manno-heptose-7-phosphate kinase [Gemmatimonadales bacterium]
MNLLPESLAPVVARLPQQRLMVLGDVMLDEFLWGDVRRISPEAPVPVVELQGESEVPGGAANNAMNAAAYGCGVAIGGVIGADPEGERLRRLLEARGVDAGGLVAEVGRPTTTKTRVVAHSQQVVRVDRERRQGVSPETQQRILAWVADHLPAVGACVISDYGKGVVTPEVAQGVIARARAAGRPVLVDPKGNDYSRYRGATVITPNLLEAEQAAGLSAESDEELVAVGRRLLTQLPGTAILITRGARGMSLFAGEGTAPVHVRSEAQAVFDVTGAGDTVITTLALGLAAGGSLPDAVALANRAAGIVVGKLGTATVSLAELRGEA